MIYIAGPLFTAAERDFNLRLASAVRMASGDDVFLPQEACADCKGPEEIFRKCIGGINNSRLVLALLDGPDSDSGTCFEAGYAYANKIPLVGILTDFRRRGEDHGLNLMLSRGCDTIVALSCLDRTDTIPDIINGLSPYLRGEKNTGAGKK
jgi:nucleoside 2-deoxyribosyltransferase